MILMAGLLLGFLVFISGSVSTQTAMDQLDQTVRDNLQQVDMTDGSLQLGESFRFYNNGVYTLVYSQNESLLAGQVPVGFTADEPFQSGLTRPVDVRGVRYYVLDFWLPLSWEGGVWVRGILEAPENPQVVQNPHEHRSGGHALCSSCWLRWEDILSPGGPSAPWTRSHPPQRPSTRRPTCPAG